MHVIALSSDASNTRAVSGAAAASEKLAVTGRLLQARAAEVGDTDKGPPADGTAVICAVADASTADAASHSPSLLVTRDREMLARVGGRLDPAGMLHVTVTTLPAAFAMQRSMYVNKEQHTGVSCSIAAAVLA